MRNPIIIAAFLCSLLGPVSAGASEDTPREDRDDIAEVKTEAASADDVYIPWTWDDVEE